MALFSLTCEEFQRLLSNVRSRHDISADMRVHAERCARCRQALEAHISALEATGRNADPAGPFRTPDVIERTIV